MDNAKNAVFIVLGILVIGLLLFLYACIYAVGDAFEEDKQNSLEPNTTISFETPEINIESEPLDVISSGFECLANGGAWIENTNYPYCDMSLDGSITDPDGDGVSVFSTESVSSCAISELLDSEICGGDGINEFTPADADNWVRENCEFVLDEEADEYHGPPNDGGYWTNCE